MTTILGKFLQRTTCVSNIRTYFNRMLLIINFKYICMQSSRQVSNSTGALVLPQTFQPYIYFVKGYISDFSLIEISPILI